MGMQVNDALLSSTFALPNGAATTQSSGFDLMNGSRGDFLAPVELQIEAPALSTGQLGDAQTITYEVWHDTAVGFGSETRLASAVIVQTGAGGAGDGAETVRFRLPVDVNQYVRVKAVKVGASNASTASAVARLVF